MIPNRPCGWAGFVALRRPATIPPKRHGNWRHGRYAADGIAAWREARMVLRHFRRGLAMPPRPVTLGWQGFLRTRGGGR